MKSILILAVAALGTVLTLASPASAGGTTIQVDGQVAGGNTVTATCTVVNGKIVGTGVLYGVNPSNGYKYSYPFTITQGTTAQGKLVLKGSMTAGPSVTLSATAPSGAMVFSYVVNGTTYSLGGQGTVVLK